MKEREEEEGLVRVLEEATLHLEEAVLCGSCDRVYHVSRKACACGAGRECGELLARLVPAFALQEAARVTRRQAEVAARVSEERRDELDGLRRRCAEEGLSMLDMLRIYAGVGEGDR